MERSKTYDQLEYELRVAHDELASLRGDGPMPAHRHVSADKRAERQDAHVDTSASELISALKEAQDRIQRLSEQSHQFQHLVSSVVNYAIFAMDLDGTITSWNLGAERMKLWKAEEILGQHLRVLYLPEDRELRRPEAHLREAAARGFYQHECKRMRKNGEVFDAFVSITPIFDENGLHIGFSKVTQELTEQKKLEAHRSEIAGLEQARVVREREVAEERVEALQEASSHKDDFLGILSHELRTPINAIMGFGSILDDEIPGPLNSDQHRFIGKILRGSEDLLSLINDLLDMSRIQAGKFHVEPAPMRLHEVVESVTEHLRPMLDRRVCRFEVDVPPHLPVLMADERRIRQVLANLITNAVKYSPERCEIAVRACRTGDHLRCEIADNGAGISAGDRQRLFHPFEQLDMSKTRRAGGIGLGLSIVKALVEAHGGHVGVESDGPGRGSTFYFVLPLAG